MKKVRLLALILTICTVLTSTIGCGKEKSDSQNSTNDIVVLPADMSEASENSIPITITFINMCGTDIGMFSMIDPNTGEQLNLMPLADQETVSIEANWPKDNYDFQWALYNGQGELCIEATSDLTGITSSAILLVSGDGDVENVEVTLN